MTICTGLQDPGGTISKSGRSSSGSLTEIDLVAAVTVPDPGEHHVTDVQLSVAKGAAGTIFRLYGRTSSSASWTQVDDFEIGDYGVFTLTLGTSHKFKANEQWKLTVQQTTIARCAARVGGQAKNADVRDF